MRLIKVQEALKNLVEIHLPRIVKDLSSEYGITPPELSKIHLFERELEHTISPKQPCVAVIKTTAIEAQEFLASHSISNINFLLQIHFLADEDEMLRKTSLLYAEALAILLNRVVNLNDETISIQYETIDFADAELWGERKLKSISCTIIVKKIF
jgi:hypothetical protein